jgi:hypothetical protein
LFLIPPAIQTKRPREELSLRYIEVEIMSWIRTKSLSECFESWKCRRKNIRYIPYIPRDYPWNISNPTNNKKHDTTHQITWFNCSLKSVTHLS